MLAPRPTPKLEDHPSSAVRDCLFNIFATILHIGGRSSIRNLRTRHAMVTGTHLSRGETGHRGLNWLRRRDIRRYKRHGGVPTPTSATTRRHEYHNGGAGGRGTWEREAGNQKWRNCGGSYSSNREGGERDPIEWPQKNKKNENREDR